MKIRLRPFRTFTRSRTLPSPTRDAGAVAAVARELLERFELDAAVRLIGVGVAGLIGDGEGERPSGGEAAPALPRATPPSRSSSISASPEASRDDRYRVVSTVPVEPNPSFALVAAVRSYSRLPA